VGSTEYKSDLYGYPLSKNNWKFCFRASRDFSKKKGF